MFADHYFETGSAVDDDAGAVSVVDETDYEVDGGASVIFVVEVVN